LSIVKNQPKMQHIWSYEGSKHLYICSMWETFYRSELLDDTIL